MAFSRALLGIQKKQLADRDGVSVQTIQRMEASAGLVRGGVESLMKVVTAPESSSSVKVRPVPDRAVVSG